MPAWTALALIAALILATTVAGLAWRSTTGRVQRAARSVVTPAELGVPGGLGERATLLQFSTELCSPCRSARRILAEAASGQEGVVHLEVDLTHRPDLASRFNILHTPTVLLLDDRGEVRGRIAGVPRPAQLAHHLRHLMRGNDDVSVA